MAILGGSPLGLVGVQSTPHNPSAKGRSTFNGGGSRNVNVASYNSSKNNVYYAPHTISTRFSGLKYLLHKSLNSSAVVVLIISINSS